MDKLEAMRVFAAVVKGNSFIEASRNLDLSAPAVTRSVARLETELGVKLFHRTTRSIRLTDSGRRYYEDVVNIIESIEEAESAVIGSYQEPQGNLLITAPVMFGQLYIVPIISDFLNKNPKVTVNSVFHDRITNLLEDNLDVAIRIGQLSDSSLFATTIGSVRKIVCASPTYLEACGEPSEPGELSEHSIVQSDTVETSSTWCFGSEKVKVTPRYRCNHNMAAIRAAELGVGLVRVMSYQAAKAIDSGTLVPVLEEHEPESLPINIIYLEGRKANAKTRAFVEFCADKLRNNRMLNPD
jgi:DNA-binding transcriptional LysR family regulator